MAITAEVEARALDASVFPSLPHVAVRMIQLSRDPKVTVREIGDCLSADPALVQKILRTVNSPLYGLRSQVSTITRAITLLGLNALKGLVLGFSLARDAGKEEGEDFSMVTFWRYCLTNGMAAHFVAARVRYHEPEEAFVGGLLQDIGVLALHRAAPKDYAEVLRRRREALGALAVDCDPATVANLMCEIERQALGTDHARIGGRLCKRWGLPDILSVPVRYHHTPTDLKEASQRVFELTRILNLAALVGQMYNIAGKRSSIEALDRFGETYFGLTPADVEDILGRIAGAVNDAAEQFDIEIGRQLNYEEILEQANSELVNLTLAAHRNAKEDARQLAQVERRAKQLESLNLHLADQANRDPLTGVFNRGFFDRFLTEQFAWGRTAGQPLGMILIDIHRFKEVNDTYGHPQGDAVIIELARRLRGATRDSDMLARYGGDEFVVVLPRADFDIVRSIAARLRGSVWDQPFPALGGGTIAVSIGIGAVCVRNFARAQGPPTVLAVADKLLYATKRRRDRKIFLVRI